jgi:hypothetical protein
MRLLLVMLAIGTSSVVLPLHGTRSGSMLPTATPIRMSAAIEPLAGTNVRGTVTFVIDDGILTVTSSITGLRPGERVLQNVHYGPQCHAVPREVGAIMMNLDSILSVSGESSVSGRLYPVADGQGNLHFVVSRPIAELDSEFRKYFRGDTYYASSFANLRLETRFVKLRSYERDTVALACGPIRRLR